MKDESEELLFKYKSGEPIQFYKCKSCGEIITGALYHSLEYCKCEHWVDQEECLLRACGEFENVTETLSNEEKRKIFTKTIFNQNIVDSLFIKEEIKHPRFDSIRFDINYYKQLYKEWKKENKKVKLNE